MSGPSDLLQSLIERGLSGKDVDQSDVPLTIEELVKSRPAQICGDERDVLAGSSQHHTEIRRSRRLTLSAVRARYHDALDAECGRGRQHVGSQNPISLRCRRAPLNRAHNEDFLSSAPGGHSWDGTENRCFEIGL